MVNIIERDGIITLDGQYFDLKIDNNRKIYIKKKNENQFKGLDEEVEVGMSSQEKQQYLYELYTMILKKLQDRRDGGSQRTESTREEPQIPINPSKPMPKGPIKNFKTDIDYSLRKEFPK